MKIPAILRVLRAKRRESSHALARKVAIARRTYLNCEHCKSFSSFNLYLKLADALEVNPVVLMAYFTGQAHEVSVSLDKRDMVDLTEVVKFYKEHANRLEAYRLRIEAELTLVKEMID